MDIHSFRLNRNDSFEGSSHDLLRGSCSVDNRRGGEGETEQIHFKVWAGIVFLGKEDRMVSLSIRKRISLFPSGLAICMLFFCICIM